MYLNFAFMMEQYRYTSISSYEYQISSKKTLLSTHVFVDYHLESLVLDEIQLLAKALVTFQLKYFLIFLLSHSYFYITCLIIWSSVTFQRLAWALCCRLESKSNTLKSKVCAQFKRRGRLEII